MNLPERKGPSLAGIGAARRQAVRVSTAELVKTAPMGDHPLPLVVQPATEGVDLLTWAREHHDEIDKWLMQHGGLLFRGFGPQTSASFEAFAIATSEGGLMTYRDRSTPRLARGTNVYTSTIYPSEERINLHNEGTYWVTWPLKIFFCCTRAADEGGATPIANVARVYGRIDPDVRARFEEKGVMYVRNYNDGFGLPWQEVYQTESRDEVEAYCRQNEIAFEWKDGDRLRTRQVRPAVRTHPHTGEKVWFNHAAFFHVSAREPEIRRRLVETFGEDGLPYNTYYGDGTPIADETVAHLFEAYEAETYAFPWQEGDIMMLNNMTVAHAREPYKGEREVLAAMTEPHSGQASSA